MIPVSVTGAQSDVVEEAEPVMATSESAVVIADSPSVHVLGSEDAIIAKATVVETPVDATLANVWWFKSIDWKAIQKANKKAKSKKKNGVRNGHDQLIIREQKAIKKAAIKASNRSVFQWSISVFMTFI